MSIHLLVLLTLQELIMVRLMISATTIARVNHINLSAHVR